MTRDDKQRAMASSHVSGNNPTPSPVAGTPNESNKPRSKRNSFMYAAVASLVGGQVAMSAYVESNNSSSSGKSNPTQSAETILARSSVTTTIPAAEKTNDISSDTVAHWEMWDRDSIMPSETEGHKCRWTNYIVGDNTVPICVHPQKDIISDRIVSNGSLGHCHHLVDLWNEAEVAITASISGSGNSNINSNSLRGTAVTPKRRERDHFFVDVGANLGACLLTVLLSTPQSTKVVAFEPNPDNQFCLTSTLMSLPAELRDRVYFYPIALGSSRSHGNTPSIAKMYSLKNNMGNSVVHHIVGSQNESQNGLQGPIDIVIEPLDQVMKLHRKSNNSGTEMSNIPLVKLDGMGFECEILKGMESTLPFVGTVTLDIYGTHDGFNEQQQFGCDARYVFKILNKFNFHIYVNGQRVTSPPLEDGYEIVAKSFD